MLLINFELNLIQAWSARCFIIGSAFAGQEPTLTITDAKLYVPVITLSTQDNGKLLQQLKSGFKRISYWNKYHLEIAVEQQNRFSDILINPNVQGVTSFNVLSFENNVGRASYTRYYLPVVERKAYNVMINGRNFF